MGDVIGTQETTQIEETTQRVEATPEEQELNRLSLERVRAAQPGQIQTQQSGLSLINQLLTGQDLPGFLKGLPGGISPEVTGNIVQQSLADVRPGLQASGLLDSGVRAELEASTASDIRNQSEQFNIGNLLNLLNLAVGGQAQIQSPLLGQSGQLGQQLAGLRSSFGTSQTTQTNPFITGKDITSGIGTGVAAKVAFACFPEEQLVDIKGGNKKIEDVKAGDTIIFNDGKESSVIMKYEFFDSPSTFINMKLSGGSAINPCNNHRIDGKISAEYNVGDTLQGKTIISMEETTRMTRTYDLLTSAENGSYSVNGITVESMIPELHTLFNSVNGFKKEEIKGGV